MGERTLSSVAQDAAKIRATLKAKWPHIKFSVRSESYSMGSSINVSWTDGPTTAQVDVVAKPAEKVDRDQWGEILSGGNRFVFCRRETSERLKRYAKMRLGERVGMNEWDRSCEEQQLASRTEVRPDGQLIEWDRFAKFAPTAPTTDAAQ